MDETESFSGLGNVPPGAPGFRGPPGGERADRPEGESPGAGGDAPERPPISDPEKIGRYAILRRLGRGGFGVVFLGRDDELDRLVAIKVPNPERIARPKDIQAFLAEARILARLDHPHIVPVFDVGHTEEGLCYVVSKLIEGSDLATKTIEHRPDFRVSANLVATIAEALDYAHGRGLVHRDIKPGNILLDASDEPCLVDFGLAVRDEDFAREGGLAGTPAYMSPEQARGEGHLVDGRSDIFSLGAVFYELLTGRRAFTGGSLSRIIEQVARAEFVPPRRIDGSIPRELERICMKAMSRRASERYNIARNMAEDLRLYLRTTGSVLPSTALASVVEPASTHEDARGPVACQRAGSEHGPVKIVPKGLRSFDGHDAYFFLELLPGPRDRTGLPESVRFWKSKIEEVDADRTFRVGLIYGPSGCGKSSLIKAGLLPRLGGQVIPVYIEATSEETEARLLRRLRKACPELPRGMGLAASMGQLRRGCFVPADRKVLVVIDQFEQWLSARRAEANTKLIAALRHCDGGRLQAIVTVRDDFWMAASRFMREIDTRLVEDENSAAVDLFDLPHARRVLSAFGAAYQVLPEKESDVTSEQQAFLEQSIDGLAKDGRIVPVRLALFAEMMKGRPWTPRALHEVGGAGGVGLTFLEETFRASTAPPEHRFHQKAAQAVLKALLPESDTEIKGRMRSRGELLDVSGYSHRPEDFDDLVRILDRELHLITPTDPEGLSRTDWPSKPAGQSYQLTHDYLVRSLREWLTRWQRETRRGRAELRLAECAASWNARPENRLLPSALEWASLRLLTRKEDWTGPQRRMMNRAARVRGLRVLGTLALISLICWAGWEVHGRLRSAALADSIEHASTPEVPAIVARLSKYRRWANPLLARLSREAPPQSRQHLHVSIAQLPDDPTQVDYLFNCLCRAAPSEFLVLRDALRPYRTSLIPKLWAILETARPGDGRILPVAGALASYDPDNSMWTATRDKVARALVSANPILLGTWLDALRRDHGKLAVALADVFRDANRSEIERAQAVNILADYAGDDPKLVADLLLDVDDNAYATLFPVANRHVKDMIGSLQAEMSKQAAPAKDGRDPESLKDELAARQARAAITLLRLGQPEEVWKLMRHGADPRLRSFLINWLHPLGADPKLIADEFESITPAPAKTANSNRQGMEDVLFQAATSMRRALILALGTYGLEGLPRDRRESLSAKLLDLYRDDPDAGIHGAADWTLRKWGHQEKLNATDTTLSKRGEWGNLRWRVNPQGQTFSLVQGPVELRMGTAPEHNIRNEAPRRVQITRSFAIAAREVTVREFQRFLKQAGITIERYQLPPNSIAMFSPDPDGPWVAPDWYTAAHYCNWLSEREGLPKDQWCYVPNPAGAYAEGMSIPADVLSRGGYRMPTEAEWEYACRAGASTIRPYGNSTALLDAYAWYQANSKEHAWRCGSLLPNDLGLFDMLGNDYEWVQDGTDRQMPMHANLYEDVITKPEVVLDKQLRRIRGGSFHYRPAVIRSDFRDSSAPSYRSTSGGIRLCRTRF